MEESSEAHMETDVSSTTDDVLETQEVTGSHRDVEMVIVVEAVKEEDDTSTDLKQRSTVSSVSTSCETTPQKETLSQKNISIPPVQENDVSKKLFMSLINSESQKVVNKTPQVSVAVKTSSTKQQPVSSDSSTSLETKLSPGQSVEKTIDTSHIKNLQVQKVIHKSPFKDMKLVSKSPIKLKRTHDKPLKEISMQETSTKIIQEKPNIEVNFKKSVNKQVKAMNLQETVNEQRTLIESSPNNEVNIQDNPNEKVLLVGSSPIKESNIKKSLNVELILIETSSNKETQKTQERARDEVKSQEKSPNKEKTSPIPNTEVMEVEITDKEDNIKNKSTTEAKSADSTPTTVIKDTVASSSSSTKSKVTNKDISITDNETENTVNGINKKMNVGENMDISVLPTNETNDTDLLNESQVSDITEKEHSKSISRELKSLIKSAKDSKIISECTRLTSKSRRKSKSQLDVSNTSLNASQDLEKIGGNRRGSTNSQVSNSSEKSDRALKRSMRSQNPEFVSKCKLFLNSVNSKGTKELDDAMSEDDSITNPKERADGEPEHNGSPQSNPKKKKLSELPVQMDKGKVGKLRCDAYCWRCHWTVEQEENDKAHPPMQCTVCPRSYHYKCLSTNERKTPSEKNWVCPDCLQILHAESSDTRSAAMKKTSLGMLCDLLKFALERMMDLNGVEPFMHPVDRNTFPDYDKYVIHPMDLTQMKKNIADGLYGSTEAFAADAQWILHNSIIFNTCEQAFLQSKLTGGARALVRSCRAEMGEIEACPECYAAAHARKPTWFTDVCTTPHILLWAKLKGFPYWPAKGMTVNSSGLVDVRFFGAHDRAWVPAKDCFLFSEKDPNNFRNKRQDILDSMQEAEQHIRNISRKYGKFVYPPFKTQFDPSKLTEQIKIMIPSFEGELKVQSKDKPTSASPFASKMKRRSSKGSKSSVNDGDVSESDETSARTEVIKRKESSNERLVKADSPVILNVSTPQVIETITTRKRRRSNLEEAIMTVIETSVTKKRKLEIPESKKADSTEKRKAELQQPSSSKEAETNTPKIKSKDDEPSSSTVEKESLRVTPIKLVALPGQNKLTPKLFTATKVPSKSSTPNSGDKTPDDKTLQRQKSTISDTSSTSEKAKEDNTPQSKTSQRRKSRSDKPSISEKTKEDKTQQRRQSSRSDKSSSSEKAKEDKSKSEKRSISRNKSLNSSNTPKEAKTAEKKSDSDCFSSKEIRLRDKKEDSKEAESEANKSKILSKPIDAKSSKERIKYDDDTVLAVIARQRHQNCDGLPTISNVCSLSTSSQSAKTTTTPITSTASRIEITIEANSNSSIFTPTSTDSVRNMKDAVTKLQKLRDNTEPVVGRVGVRAFARMTSPGRSDKSVEVEIKSEPIDLDESDESRLNEKMDLMNACKLQPVTASNLRDVRINRVMAGPTFTVNKGKVEARPRAKKTFPQPRRTDESRSELNAKNSMVYIPIRPPPTQAPPPLRQRSVAAPRPGAPTSGTTLNAVISPSKSSMVAISSPTCVSAMMTTAGQVNVPSVVTVGQVPTAVHTVPLMTSVNGQWMFSLQPVMSVGVGDGSTNTPIVNGLPERGTATPTIVPLAATVTPTSTPTATTATTTATRPTDNNSTPAELPRLQRPAINNPFDVSPAGTAVPVPSSAGPLTAKLNQNAGKLADYFRMLLEDCLDKLDAPGATAAARLQLESSRWRHSLEIEELKHNHELTMAEMRLSFEKDKLRVISETKRAAQLELDAAVKLAKSKQWCANCSQEAQLYCCWNTAYCDYPCQRLHWPLHFANCAQRPQDGNEDEANPSEPRLQKQPDNLPKGAPPALTVGGKVATTRVYAPESAQKTSIIVSMVEDNSGNQTMKCVGTYKPNQAQMPPLLLNKQVINDETAKKVVTSGGYLIVGSSGTAASVITPAPSRRSHAIQYFT